jgi:DNA-binding transcriptional regulator YiaG
MALPTPMELIADVKDAAKEIEEYQACISVAAQRKADLVVQLHNKHRMTYQDIANHLGVSRQAISNWIRRSG